MPGPGSQKAPGDTQTERLICSSEVYRLPGQTTCPTLTAQLLGSASPLASVCPALCPHSPPRGRRHTTAWQASRALVTWWGVSQPCTGADRSSHSSVL